jgi:hypothetical protein
LRIWKKDRAGRAYEYFIVWCKRGCQLFNELLLRSEQGVPRQSTKAGENLQKPMRLISAECKGQRSRDNQHPCVVKKAMRWTRPSWGAKPIAKILDANEREWREKEIPYSKALLAKHRTFARDYRLPTIFEGKRFVNCYTRLASLASVTGDYDDSEDDS